MRWLTIGFALLSLLSASCAAAPSAAQPPVVYATAEGAGNSAAVSVSGAAVTVDLRSAGGIGAATLALAPGPAPGSLVLQLHLAGLEELRISYGDEAAVISVASDASHTVSQIRLGPDGAERQLMADDPRWAPVQIRPAATPPALDLITVTLPPDLSLSETTRSLEVAWVDFFR